MAAKSNNLLIEHQNIILLFSKIDKHLNPMFISANIDEILSLLFKLNKSLKEHLDNDQLIYITLNKYNNIKIVELSNNFEKEIKTLSILFEKYYSKWNRADHIKSEPYEFIKQTKLMIKALTARFEKENQQLYSIYDKL